MKHLGAWQEGKRCVKARGVFSGCRFQIADLMCFLTLTFSYFLWMISLNRYGVYGEISNNQAVSQSFWNWQTLALQRPAQKLVEGTTRCWAQRSVGITTYIYLLLYWQVFRNDAETWFQIQLVIMAYASKWYILGILGPALTNNAIGCSWWPCDDIFMSCLGFIGHVWDFQKHMDYPPNSIIQIILADSLYRDLDPINKPSFLTSYPKILSLLRESPLIKVNRSWCDVSFWWNIPSYHMLPASPVAYLPIPDILGETEPPRDSRDQRSSRWPDTGRGMAYGSWGANTKKKTGAIKLGFWIGQLKPICLF